MIVNNLTLPLYEVGDEVEYIGGNDEAGQRMFPLHKDIKPPYIVTGIGIERFHVQKSPIKRGKPILKFAITINHACGYAFVPWMFEKKQPKKSFLTQLKEKLCIT